MQWTTGGFIYAYYGSFYDSTGFAPARRIRYSLDMVEDASCGRGLIICVLFTNEKPG